jgi:hypothetical protein
VSGVVVAAAVVLMPDVVLMDVRMAVLGGIEAAWSRSGAAVDQVAQVPGSRQR